MDTDSRDGEREYRYSGMVVITFRAETERPRKTFLLGTTPTSFLWN